MRHMQRGAKRIHMLQGIRLGAGKAGRLELLQRVLLRDLERIDAAPSRNARGNAALRGTTAQLLYTLLALPDL